MNDHELDIALGVIGRRRTDVAVPPALRERVAMVPSATPHRHGWRPRIARWPRPLFSTAKFVLAATIVALFGGLVLLGILAGPEADRSAPATMTPSPSPVTVDEMLAGMTVTSDEELGLIWVENDGHRDIYREPGWGEGEIRVGRDGSVWIIWPAGRFFRLGDETMYDLDGFYDREHDSRDIGSFEVGPDGTLWAVARGGIAAFDPEIDEWAWIETGGATVHAMAIGSDGTIWATTDDALIQFAADGLTEHAWPSAAGEDMNPYSIGVSDDGAVWLMRGDDLGQGSVVRFDGDEWHSDPLPGPVPYVGPDVSRDGILWVPADEGPVQRSLARFDGTDWVVFTEADGVRPWAGKAGFAPDGTLQASVNGRVLVDATLGGEYPQTECGGVGRFDGTTWMEIPSPWCVTDADAGPDGSVWLLGPPGPLDDGLRLTVIRPEVPSRE
jgi:hypothetical protein